MTAEVPEPAVSEDDGSSGAVVAIPEYSWTSRATEVAAVTAVTLVTGAAADVYQSSPSELCPDTEVAPMRCHTLPAESVTAVMWLVVPVARLADSTSRSPAADGACRPTVVVVDDADWMSVGVVGGAGVVTTAAVLGWDTLFEPS